MQFSIKFLLLPPLSFAVVIFENFRLTPFNTFGIEANCKYFAEARDNGQLLELLKNNGRSQTPHLLLGGGSNILFAADFQGLVIKVATKGISITRQTEDFVWVEAQAGENWDDFVQYCVANDWGGIENLSAIPGNVGSSPIQNIGAYGVELKDVFDSLMAWDKISEQIVKLTKDDCEFGYRDSIFKRKEKDRFAILSVTLRLSIKNHVVNTHYGTVTQFLQQMGILSPGIRDVRKAIVSIRQQKLPDPGILGNAGSFFKNPVLSEQQFNEFIEKFPNAVWYPDNNKFKIAAGWLIEQTGWKGYREKDAGVHTGQALVLVNYGTATGMEILNLAGKIIDSVFEKYCILLETEVNVLH